MHFAAHMFPFVQCTLSLVPSILCHIATPLILHQADVPLTTYPIPHTICLVPRTSRLVLCTPFPAPRTLYFIPHTMYLVHNSRPAKKEKKTLTEILELGTEAVQGYFKLPSTTPCGGAPIQPVYV